MEDSEFLKQMAEVAKKQKEHIEFYSLAEKYGFCSTWCHLNNSCELCEK